jgi:biopolymer transport protein ExbD
MQHAVRLILIPLIAAGMTGAAWAMEGPVEKAAAPEYKRADTNFYGKGDVLKAHPSAMIISEGILDAAGMHAVLFTGAPGGNTVGRREGDSYFLTAPKKAPKEIYCVTASDWIEPITPPGATTLGIAPDVMQIREPQGDVQVALPSAPANFSAVTDGMALPNGAVVKTGANGTAAVLFGGVDSARLMPNSEAAVQQTVTAQARSAEVDLTTGGVFSKVGTQVGVKGEYEVHTPFGNAVVHGTDFVTVVMPARTDVWIAQGTVELVQPDGKSAGVVTADGAGPLKIIRFPTILDSQLSIQADTETLTALLDFIPLANQKIKALRGKATLTADEEAYLKRIKSVPCLIKLALVEPPAPTPAASAPTPPRLVGPRPLAPAPPVAPAPVATATPSPNPTVYTSLNGPEAMPPAPSPAGPPPIRAVVRVDGKINFKGATYDLPGFKSTLEAMVKATPDQSIVIHAGKTVTYDKLKAVFDVCRDVNVQYVSAVAAAPATPQAEPTPAANLPTPGLLLHPSMEPMAGTPAENPAPTNAPAATSP